MPFVMPIVMPVVEPQLALDNSTTDNFKVSEIGLRLIGSVDNARLPRQGHIATKEIHAFSNRCNGLYAVTARNASYNRQDATAACRFVMKEHTRASESPLRSPAFASSAHRAGRRAFD